MKTKLPARAKFVLGIFLLLVIAVSSLIFIEATKTVSGEEPIGEQTEINQGFIGSSSGTIWQSLYVTNVDGSSYWANAPKPFSLQSIAGSQSGTGDDFKEVATLQNNIYMNLNVPYVTAWTFSCKETIAVTDMQGNIVTTLVDAQTVNEHGNSAAQGQNTWVTGASLSGQQLQDVINLPPGEYYFTVTLSNINLSITKDGQQQNLSAAAGNVSNELSWLIQVS